MVDLYVAFFFTSANKHISPPKGDLHFYIAVKLFCCLNECKFGYMLYFKFVVGKCV